MNTDEWQVDRIITHKGFKSDASFLILWKTGDKTWLPYSKIQDLQPLKEYFETLGIQHIGQLPPIVDGEDPIEGMDSLFTGSVEFLEYKYPLNQDLDFPLSLNLIAFPAMSTAPATPFFAPRDHPGIVLKWKEQVFEVTCEGTPSVQISVDDMILAIQTSAALCRGWKIPITPRYVKITRAINNFLPFKSITWFTFINNGKTYNSKAVIGYDCFFTTVQQIQLREAGKITKKLNFDVNKTFPKPPRPLSGHDNRCDNCRSGGSSNLFTRLSQSQADRDIMVLGLMSYVRQAESKSCGKKRFPKSVRGAEAYQKFINGDGSTITGLSDCINAWCITTPGKVNDAMDSSGPSAAGPSAGPSTA
ncbi:hypothetical protein EV360DRAFT_76792 [Lentinula raphanica]|nr:hypothetical protein EV360DRAFT_76792 [Lentinula raphanica]